MRWMEHPSYEERLRESGLFSMEKSLGRDFQYLKKAARKLERDFLQGHGVTGQGVMASS